MTWPPLKYFTENENWGEPDKISRILLRKLDHFRGRINEPIFVSCGTQGLHMPNSYHYQGVAVDILFPEQKNSFLDLFLEAEKLNFSGIGLYPDWVYAGRIIGGMHLDIRPGDLKARWVGVKKDAKTEYLALNKKVLSEYKLI